MQVWVSGFGLQFLKFEVEGLGSVAQGIHASWYIDAVPENKNPANTYKSFQSCQPHMWDKIHMYGRPGNDTLYVHSSTFPDKDYTHSLQS